MGCDGGTIPKRDELVRTKKKPEQKDRASELSFRWQHCSIKQDVLKHPIVACGYGKLYNKDAVIEKLLEKSMPESGCHIKSLKDIKELKLTENPDYTSSSEKGDSYIDTQRAPFICPLSGLEMNGKYKFCFSWLCGCVISERALKQISDKTCINCATKFTDEDIVVLNATDEDFDVMKTRLGIRQQKIKANKKPKSKPSNVEGEVKIKIEKDDDAKTEVKSKVGAKNNGKLDALLKRTSTNAIEDPAYKKSKESYSVSNDPAASEVYKSLFTTHDDDKSQERAHWVTYNPFYR